MWRYVTLWKTTQILCMLSIQDDLETSFSLFRRMCVWKRVFVTLMKVNSYPSDFSAITTQQM